MTGWLQTHVRHGDVLGLRQSLKGTHIKTCHFVLVLLKRAVVVFGPLGHMLIKHRAIRMGI